METKKYLNQLLDLPQMVNDKLKVSCWNSMVENSESTIPNWINTFFKLAALVLLLVAFWGGVNYLADTQNGAPVYDMENPMTYEEYVPMEKDSLGKVVEGTGDYVDFQMKDEDGNLQYYQKELVEASVSGIMASDDEEDGYKYLKAQAKKLGVKVSVNKDPYGEGYDELGFSGDKAAVMKLAGISGHAEDITDGVYDLSETRELVFERDLKIFNTGKGILGLIGYFLAFFFWLYAVISLANVLRSTGNEISNSQGNILELVLRDGPLALIRAAGYIGALLALFAAIGHTFTWLTSIDLGAGSDVWGDAGGFLSVFSEFSNIGVLAIATLMGMTDIFSSVDPQMLMSQLTNTMSEGSVVEWLNKDDLVIVIGSYWNVIVILIGLFINLLIWKWVYALGHTFVKWISGPYFPHKSL